MKNASRLLSFALALALLLAPGLSGCAQSAARPDEKNHIKIGVSVYDQYDTFVGVLMDYFREYVSQAQQDGGVTITVIEEGAGGNQTGQNGQVESFIAAGCDVLCINLVDRAEASFTIDTAKSAGIPVLFFNRELVEEDLDRWEQLYYIGAPASESGRIQAEIVADLWEADRDAVDKNGDGVLQYVMLEGEAGHQDAIMRTESSVGELQNRGYRLERLEDEIANWNRAQAETKMSLWLAEHGAAIELVLANNDDMALGAIDALKKAGLALEDYPVVVGIDGTPVGLAAVVAGEMAGTVLNDAAGQAKALFELAYSLSLTGAPPDTLSMENGRYIRLPYKMITEDNAAYYIDEKIG